jgi:hypothetical protein
MGKCELTFFNHLMFRLALSNIICLTHDEMEKKYTKHLGHEVISKCKHLPIKSWISEEEKKVINGVMAVFNEKLKLYAVDQDFTLLNNTEKRGLPQLVWSLLYNMYVWS